MMQRVKRLLQVGAAGAATLVGGGCATHGEASDVRTRERFVDASLTLGAGRAAAQEYRRQGDFEAAKQQDLINWGNQGVYNQRRAAVSRRNVLTPNNLPAGESITLPERPRD